MKAGDIFYPPFNLMPKEKKNCVYMLVYNDDRFYIGSTIDLRKRLGGHKTAYFTYRVNRSSRPPMEDASYVKILCVAEGSLQDLREKESEYLSEHRGDKNIINKVFKALYIPPQPKSLIPLPKKICRNKQKRSGLVEITKRDIELVQMMVDEVGLQQIALQTSLSPRTIEDNLAQIRRKHNCRTTVALVMLFLRKGWAV